MEWIRREINRTFFNQAPTMAYDPAENSLVDGSLVGTAGLLEKALATHKPGDSIVLDVVDQSGPRRVRIVIAKRPATLPGG